MHVDREAGPATLAERTYRAVREAIGTGRLRPGEKVTERGLAERFAVSRVRNSERFGAGLPADVLERVRLHFLDYDRDTPALDWSPVEQAVARWREVHQRLLRSSIENEVFLPERPLSYRDGGTFMEISRRVDGFAHYRLDALQSTPNDSGLKRPDPRSSIASNCGKRWFVATVPSTPLTRLFA